MKRKAYPSDVSDDELAVVARYLTLMTADAPSVDQGYRGKHATQAAQAPTCNSKGSNCLRGQARLVLLLKRWVVECSNAWAARFRRLARDDAQLAETLKGLHFVAFAILMLQRFVELIL